MIQFERYQLVLMPKTASSTQSIHIDLHASQLSQREAQTVINRFLSVLTWCDDQFAITQGGWSGNPVPVPVPKRNLAFVATDPWLLGRNIPETDERRRAIALYREGRNAEQTALISYAVLSYFKAIEIRWPDKDGKKLKRWIANNLNSLPSPDNEAQIQHFLTHPKKSGLRIIYIVHAELLSLTPATSILPIQMIQRRYSVYIRLPTRCAILRAISSLMNSVFPTALILIEPMLAKEKPIKIGAKVVSRYSLQRISMERKIVLQNSAIWGTLGHYLPVPVAFSWCKI